MKQKIKPVALGSNAFSLRFLDGALTSLKYAQDTIDTEYVLPGSRLGDLLVAWRPSPDAPWHETDTALMADRTGATGSAVGFEGYTSCYEDRGLALTNAFRLSGETLGYEITLENKSKEVMEIGDLIVPMPMNTAYEWGKDPNLSVFRHSFISGQGTYLFWMRANSQGPYLAMFPQNSSHFDYFDMRQDETKDGGHGIFRAYIHAGRDCAIATEKGCKWRQPCSSLLLQPGETKQYAYKFLWVADYGAMRQAIVDEGLVDIKVAPGMTVPQGQQAYIRLCCKDGIQSLSAEHPDDTDIQLVTTKGLEFIFHVQFHRLGENVLTIAFGGGKRMVLEFFCCQPVETLIHKRGAFIAKCQHRDETKWYDGLISEWNMETQTLLGPDNYDLIKGWRIYEVTCDDPGLCKPSFLAAKNAEFPVQSEVEALDYYIDRFVWGGLQRTDQEDYAYGIYGIPDWHTLRNSSDNGPRGNLHIWRIYDYPHIALLYFSMYRIARDHGHINLAHDKLVYLERAYRTALAMFTIPEETDEWSAYKTGLYNELIYQDIFQELYALGQREKALHLEMHWSRKARFFVNDKPDLFGSEYPFDSTGFESTHALAKYALTKQTTEEETRTGFLPDKAWRFLEAQHMGNIFCRGWLEPAYYLYGSDYRGSGSGAYTLSYMAQMGGWSVLDYALQYAADPHQWLPLGYGSILSSWALMNAGAKESGYGYWYPGEGNDGAAAGGFEPAPYGETWLEQPHHRGAWYYACEIDLGFSGALRAARTVLARDPDFGLICYGGCVQESAADYEVMLRDGLRRRFSAVLDGLRLHIELEGARMASDSFLRLHKDGKSLDFIAEMANPDGGVLQLSINGLTQGNYAVLLDDIELCRISTQPIQIAVAMEKQTAHVKIVVIE